MINVSCTCGLWRIDVKEPPDKCPKCGASARYHNKGTDYIADPWEELDVTGRRWGVFAAEGYSPDPIAIFRDEDDAIKWMNWQAELGDDSVIGNADYTICPIDALEGRAWNSHEPPPEQTT